MCPCLRVCVHIWFREHCFCFGGYTCVPLQVHGVGTLLHHLHRQILQCSYSYVCLCRLNLRLPYHRWNCRLLLLLMELTRFVSVLNGVEPIAKKIEKKRGEIVAWETNTRSVLTEKHQNSSADMFSPCLFEYLEKSDVIL